MKLKELMPTRRFFSKAEEKLLEAPNDIDKELADEMILAGEKKDEITRQPSNVDNNPMNSDERSKVNMQPTLLKGNKKLQKSQLAQLQESEVKRKYKPNEKLGKHK